MTPEQSQRYGGLVHAINAQTASSTKSGLPADAAAKVIAKAVTARKPRTRYTVGRDAALLTRLARILRATWGKFNRIYIDPQYFPGSDDPHRVDERLPGAADAGWFEGCRGRRSPPHRGKRPRTLPG